VVRSAVNMDWTDLPLRDLLQERYGLPAYVVNDSHAAALAEYTFGAEDRKPNLVVIKIGRGISAGIVLSGQLHHGDGSGAGEIGHVVVKEEGDLCRCGHRGCLETIVSSRAIVRRAQAIAQANPNSPLNRLAADPTQITTEVVLHAFAQGDPDLTALIQEAGCYLGMALANLVSALNVQKILVAGTVAKFGDALLDPARTTMQTRCLAALGADTQVELASLGTDIVILGAAALVLSNELGIV
jgi:predicted NBD/HSP70 family sugar kinase